MSVLQVEDLDVEFRTDRSTVQAVRGVSFTIAPAGILGIVGESGSGKSTALAAICGVVPAPGRVTGGRIMFGGRDLLRLDRHALNAIRGTEIGMVFQDPYASLNPVMRVGEHIAETLRIHRGLGRREAGQRTIALLESVGIRHAASRASQYPHQFSGGMQQRVMIAAAIACGPALLLADEPTTALDSTTGLNVLRLIRGLRDTAGLSIIIVTHDLRLATAMCDDVAVMHAGEIVEYGPADALASRPAHPYSSLLWRSVPTWDSPWRSRLPTIDRLRAAPDDGGKAGCTFLDRCPIAEVTTCSVHPALAARESGHLARCWATEPSGWATSASLRAL